MRKRSNIKPLPLVVAAALTLASCSSLFIGGHASAAALGQTVVRLDRLAYSTTTGGRVCAKATTTATETSVAVVFPTNSATDYTLSATVASWAATGVADTSLGATAWPGLSATNATSVSGKTVTWASGDLTVGTLYCFQFAGGLTTANNNTESINGTVITQTTGNVTSDTGSFSIGLASGAVGVGDQVAITNGVVPPTFKFTLSGNTDAFTTNISLGTVASTTGRTITVITNAANGYVVWAKDANSGGASLGALNSVTAGNFKLVGSAAVGTASRTLTNSVQDYGMGVSIGTNGSTTTTANAAYIDGGASKVGTLDPVNYQPIAAATTATGTDVMTVIERAASSTTTKAANDYADTITLVGAGLF